MQMCKKINKTRSDTFLTEGYLIDFIRIITVSQPSLLQCKKHRDTDPADALHTNNLVQAYNTLTPFTYKSTNSLILLPTENYNVVIVLVAPNYLYILWTIF